MTQPETNGRKSVYHKLPESCVSLPVNLLGVASFIFTLFLIKRYSPDMDEVARVVIAMFAAFLPIAFVDLFITKRQNAPSSGLKEKGAVNAKRVAIKLFGLAGTFSVIAFCYWVLPEYGVWYGRFFKLLQYGSPVIIVLSVIYFTAVDPRMKEPEDGYYGMGLLMLGKWSEIDKEALTLHARKWLVKAFFLPLMFIFLGNNIRFILNFDYGSLNQSFGNFFNFALTAIYSLDVIFATIGYVVTLRVLDSHIRSVEPTVFGWVVCVICYPPFWSGFFYARYFKYDDGHYWGSWLGGSEILATLWGGTILFLLLIYSVATVCFGYRFSNLTYRGVITSGPYRFCKHPAYVAKNLSWWMISVPFISSGGWDTALQMSVLLFGVNIIYYLRARTEENHLSRFPEYVEYANWMNENGLFRFIGKWIPYLRYSEERAKSRG